MNLVGCGNICGWLVNFRFILIELHEFGKIILGLLKNFDFSNHAVILKWEDFAAFFLNLFTDFFFNAIVLKFLLLNLLIIQKILILTKFLRDP